MQYYGLDLEGMLDAGDYRRARLLAEELPADSRTVRLMEPRAAWGEEAYLLALVADNLSFMRYEQAGGRGRRPQAVERPKAKAPEAKHLDVSDERIGALLFGGRA